MDLIFCKLKKAQKNTDLIFDIRLQISGIGLGLHHQNFHCTLSNIIMRHWILLDDEINSIFRDSKKYLATLFHNTSSF